jgi:adhesin transport system outer membrane protein
MFKSTFSCLFIWCLLSSGIAAADTIDEVLRKTLETNPDLLSKEAERYEQDNNLKSAFAGYLPTVDLSVSYGRDKNTNSTTRAVNGSSLTLTKRETSLSLTQMLFDGFATVSSVEAAESRVKGLSKDVFVSLENVLVRVAEVYLEVLRHRKIVGYAKENLASHQEVFQQIQLRVESGLAKKADVDQAAGRLALARTNLLEAQANLRDAETNYKRVTGFEADELMRPDVPYEQLPLTEEAAIVLAIRNSYILQRAQMDIEAARADKRSAMAYYYPTLNLEVSGSDNKNVAGNAVDTDSFSVMLKMNYNIFRGGADRASELSSSWRIEQAKETYNTTHRQVEQSIRLAWNAYTNTRSQLGYRKEHAEASQRTRDAYQDQFAIGQRTLLDLLDSENELYTSRTAYISSQYAELLGRYRVLHGISRISNHFAVTPPEATNYQPRSWIDGF